MNPTRAQIVLLHNPRCSKSRAAKALLDERGVEYVERRYLEDPLDEGELQELRRKLGSAPSAWIRPREKEYEEVGLDRDSSEEQYLAAIAAHPILLERPILIHGEAALLGRPPETILGLL